MTEKGSAIFYLSSKLQSENYYFRWCTNLKIPTIYRKCSNCDGINISQMTISEVGQIIIEEQRVQLDGAQKGRKRERRGEGERFRVHFFEWRLQADGKRDARLKRSGSYFCETKVTRTPTRN